MILCMHVHWEISIFTVRLLHPPLCWWRAHSVFSCWNRSGFLTVSSSLNILYRDWPQCQEIFYMHQDDFPPPLPSISLQRNQGNAVGYPLVPRHIKSYLWSSFSVLTSRWWHLTITMYTLKMQKQIYSFNATKLFKWFSGIAPVVF